MVPFLSRRRWRARLAPRVLSVALGVALAAPSPAWAMRQVNPGQHTGLEEELSAALGRDRMSARRGGLEEEEIQPLFTMIYEGHPGRTKFSPSGHTLAVACDDGTVRVVDATTGRAVQIIDIGRIGGDPINRVREVEALALSPADDLLALAVLDGIVEVRRVIDGRPIQSFPGHRYFGADVMFLDQDTVAFAGGNGFLRAWDIRTGRLLREFEGLGWANGTFAFSPDRRQLLTAGSHGDPPGFRVWQVEDGTLQRTIYHAHDQWPHRLSFNGAVLGGLSPPGLYLWLWDVQTGAFRWAVSPFPGAINVPPSGAVAFASGGILAAVSDGWGLVKIVDAADGRVLRTYHNPDWNLIRRVAFQPNGSRLLVQQEHSVEVLDLTHVVLQAMLSKLPSDMPTASQPFREFVAAVKTALTEAPGVGEGGRVQQAFAIRAIAQHRSALDEAFSPMPSWATPTIRDTTRRLLDILNRYSEDLMASTFSADPAILTAALTTVDRTKALGGFMVEHQREYPFRLRQVARDAHGAILTAGHNAWAAASPDTPVQAVWDAGERVITVTLTMETGLEEWPTPEAMPTPSIVETQGSIQAGA